MTHITTHEEMEVLDCILPHLIGHGKFIVSEKHLTWGILPVTLNEDRSSDLEESEKIKNDYKNRGVYKVVTKFLVDNGFADFINNDKDNEYILLTHKGDYLSAHGNLSTFNTSVALQLDEEELKERLTLILSDLSPFGEFTVMPDIRKMPLNSINTIPSGTGKEQLKYINDLLEQQQKEVHNVILTEHANLVKDERVIEYLVNHGFAINRFDIDHKLRLYRQLTEKGRMLKSLGSLSAYEDWEQAEKNKEYRRIEENDILRQTNIISGRIQQSLLTINRWIAFGTIAQALSAVLLTFVGVLKNYNWAGAVQFWVLLFVFLLGSISGLTVLITINRLLKEKEG